MSKKNKIVYSDIQPNAKEAGVWVNTTDGNIKIEKDGKWVDDGGSSSGEASTIEYLDLRGQSLGLINAVMAFAIQAKATISPDELRITYMYTASDVTFDNIVECSIDFNGYVYNKQVGLKNVCDFLSMANITQEQLDAIPRITKEEFYSLT